MFANGSKQEEYTVLPCLAPNDTHQSAVQSGTSNVIIAPGDMLWWDLIYSTVRPASAFILTYTGDTASDAKARRDFKRVYVGVSGTAVFSNPDPNNAPCEVKVYPYCEVDAPQSSGGTEGTATITLGDLFGPDGDGSGVLANQHLINVSGDATQAIGRCVKIATVAQLPATVGLQATLLGSNAQAAQDARTLIIPDGLSWAAGDIITAIPVYQLFGGPIELLGVGAYTQGAITTQAITIIVKKNSSALATLTLPTSSSARGVYVDQTQVTNQYRFFDANDTITITEGGTASPTGTVAGVVLRFRRI